MTGMREVCVDARHRSRASIPQGDARFYARRRAIPRRSRCPYAVAKYRSAASGARVDCSRSAASTPSSAISLYPSSTCPSAALPVILFTHNVEADIWRRHAENAGQSGDARLLRQQWRRMLRFERARSRGSIWSWPCRRPIAHMFQRLYPGRAARRRCTSSRPAWTRTYFTPTARPRRARRTWSSPARWTGCRTKTACSYFVRDILPRIRQVEPDATLSIVGRARRRRSSGWPPMPASR